MSKVVLYETGDGVATISLNRPETRNALNDELLLGLIAAFERARDDEGARAVVLTGAGKGFCAGADLAIFVGGVNPDMVEEYIRTRYHPLITLITSLPKPVIAAVNGVAAGAGASLALACDLRIMAHDAALMQAFTNIGLLPDAGSTWFLARLVGYSRAFEIAAEGERILAGRCAELGLANQVVPALELLEIAHARARKLAQRPTLALALTKQAMQAALNLSLADAIAYEGKLQRQTIASHDFTEGVTAFVQKRVPNFSGK
jgi:2-(1,2-epoxy-1,2-dihydrophenyl)acetyl-CoA isomerase